MSGIVPPDVVAVIIALRRPRTVPPTTSRCRYAPRTPRRLVKPSASIFITSSKRSRVSRAYGAARVKLAYSASSCHSAHATSATICCASTSSGASGMRSVSARRAARNRAAPRIRRPSRDSGNSRPFGTPPTWCPERPTRCRNGAIPRGEPTGRRDRRRRYRCRVQVMPWRRAVSVRRASGAARRRSGAPSRDCRDARRSLPCRAGRRDGAPCARRCAAC